MHTRPPRRLALAASLPLLAASLAMGCSKQPVNSVEPAQREAVPNIIDSRINQGDKGLSKALAVQEVREATLDNGHKQVQVDLYNFNANKKGFNYQFVWTTRNGMTLNEGPWHSGVIQGRERITLNSVAPTQDAVDFKLNLNSARSN